MASCKTHWEVERWEGKYNWTSSHPWVLRHPMNLGISESLTMHERPALSVHKCQICQCFVFSRLNKVANYDQNFNEGNQAGLTVKTLQSKAAFTGEKMVRDWLVELKASSRFRRCNSLKISKLYHKTGHSYCTSKYLSKLLQDQPHAKTSSQKNSCEWAPKLIPVVEASLHEVYTREWGRREDILSRVQANCWDLVRLPGCSKLIGILLRSRSRSRFWSACQVS